MIIRSVTATALGLLIWFAAVGSGLQSTPVASADPVGGADPVSGSLLQTFNFGYAGFQPYTRLTLSYLTPGATAFQILDLGLPVITDGAGQALIPLSLMALLSDPTGLPPELAPLVAFGNFVNVSWAGTTAGIASFRFDACDTLNCVDLVGVLSVTQ